MEPIVESTLIVESKPIIESTDWEDFTNEVERVKEDLVNKKGYEISLKELMAKSRSLIGQGDVSIAQVILLIDQLKSLIPLITKELEKIHKEDKDFSTKLQKESQEVEEKESQEVEGKESQEVEGKESQEVEGKESQEVEGKESQEVEVEGKESQEVEVEGKESQEVEVEGKESQEVEVEEDETDSYLAKYKEDVAAFEAQLKNKSIHVELLVQQSCLIKRHRKNNSLRIVEVAEQLSDVIGILTEARDALRGYK